MPDKSQELCLGCLLDALAAHHRTLFAWLDAGGDKRLLEFKPLDSWGPIIKMVAAAERHEAGPPSKHVH